jgi:hypothetical protein
MGLRLPENISIEEIIVCYQISGQQPNPQPGQLSLISQIRLTEMKTPDKAIVRYDEATLLNKIDPPECHTSHVGSVVPTPGAAVILALRLYFKNTTDKIMVGAVGVKIKPIAGGNFGSLES